MFKFINQKVFNRGTPPESFLNELIHFGKIAEGEIFEVNQFHDVYSSVITELGPYKDLTHRRAVMLEVMRVLAGFESSWKWTEGRDTTNSTSITAETIEAGAWQVSYNSRHFGGDLVDLLKENNVIGGYDFQKKMKQNHNLAMEYIARLLRHTVNHNGPVKRKEINPYLSVKAVEEFQYLITH